MKSKTMRKTIILSAILALGLQANAQQRWTLRDCIDYATAHNVTILQAENAAMQSEVEAQLGTHADRRERRRYGRLYHQVCGCQQPGHQHEPQHQHTTVHRLRTT